VKIVYFGSDQFSETILARIFDLPHTISAIVTAPDAKKGRGQHSASTPVALFARSHEIPCLQPLCLKDESFIDELSACAADLFVVVSYGKILPAQLLNIPRLYAINVHPSLLPKYRGPSPINYTVLNGDTETGISVIRLNETIDGGDIFVQEKLTIDSSINAEELERVLADAASEYIETAISLCETDSGEFIPQDEATRSYAPLLKKEDGLIDWKNEACVIHNQIRALIPWPSAYTHFQGKLLKFYRSECLSGTGAHEHALPGCIVSISHEGCIDVQTGSGIIRLFEVQYEGKRRMSAFDWCNGQHIKEGMCFE